MKIQHHKSTCIGASWDQEQRRHYRHWQSNNKMHHICNCIINIVSYAKIYYTPSPEIYYTIMLILVQRFNVQHIDVYEECISIRNKFRVRSHNVMAKPKNQAQRSTSKRLPYRCHPGAHSGQRRTAGIWSLQTWPRWIQFRSEANLPNAAGLHPQLIVLTCNSWQHRKHLICICRLLCKSSPVTPVNKKRNNNAIGNAVEVEK